MMSTPKLPHSTSADRSTKPSSPNCYFSPHNRENYYVCTIILVF